jgi:hypothetical protein
VQPPRTQYVERDGVSIAYQVVGDGPIDLLLAPGFISHLDLQWTEPRYARFLARLASFARSDHGEHELKGVPGPWRVYALGEETAPQVELDGAAEHMRRSDRVTVALARRAPRALRLGARLAGRKRG